MGKSHWGGNIEKTGAKGGGRSGSKIYPQKRTKPNRRHPPGGSIAAFSLTEPAKPERPRTGAN